MRHWLLRRSPHYSDIHSSTANQPWDYDKVSVDVRLKPGDVVYLTAARDELYGWGHVMKRESYRDQDIQSRAYRVTVSRPIVEQNLVTSIEIKQHSHMRELFMDSDRNLIPLKAVHVNAFNALLRSKAAPAPADLDFDEPETERVPKEDFPRIPLTPYTTTWLDAVYVRLRQGKQIRPTEMLVQLWSSLPEDFDYNKIDRRLIQHGVDLTLLGILHIDPATDLVEKTDQVIRFIRELITQQPGIETVTSEQVSEDLAIPEDDVALIFGLMHHLGDFWNGGNGYGQKPGYYSVTIRDEKVKREYLKYKDIDELLKKLAASQNENHVKEATTQTEPPNNDSHFDACLSFAGEDRPYVERVAAALRIAGVSLFYDSYEQVSLWGKDLYQHLDDVYRNRATYCVVFISRAYSDKLWTKHELKSAQARAFKENREYILPVRLDDTELPGILPTMVYLSNKSPEELAQLIIEKLQQTIGLETKAETINSATESEAETLIEQSDPGPSIAVLPFRAESEDLDNVVFCNSLTVELINTLSKVEGLKSPPLSSLLFFENKNVDVHEISKKLQVSWVLEGRVRKAQNELRINVQLVNTSDGDIRPGFSYGSALDDILQIQIEIATDVVEALKVKLRIGGKPSVFESDTVKPEAYACYMRGRYFFYEHTREGWLKAIDYFAKATSIDPGYASAYARLSSVLAFAWFYGAMHPDEAIEEWRNTNQRALELGGELAETHIAVGRFRLLYEWNWEEAEREYKRAAEINAKNADAYQQYGLLLASRGHFNEAISEAQKALKLEPLSLLVNFHAAAIYWLSSQWDKALSQIESMIELFPNSNSAYWVKGLIYSMTGEFDKAIESYLISLKLRDDNHALSSLAFTYGLAGQKEEALKIIDKLIERHKQRYDVVEDPKAPYATAYNIAGAYGGLRKSEEALEWLKRAYREKNGDLVYLKVHSTIGGEGLWGKEFRDDQRFRKLLQRVGFGS